MTKSLSLSHFEQVLIDKQTHGDLSVVISGLGLSSCDATAGYAFIAVPGTLVDGRNYIQKAIDVGASAIIAESENLTTSQQQLLNQLKVPWILVKNLRQQIGVLAAELEGHPANKLNLVGITGTNGKTSICQMSAEIIKTLAGECGHMGTLGNGLVNRLKETINTTSEPITIHKNLNKILKAGARHTVMEVSSHALEQGRVNGLKFKVAVFTNLTRDHLDYHPDMEAYAESKRRLFLNESLEYAVINADDEMGRKLLADPEIKAKKIAFSLKDTEISAQGIEGIVRARNIKFCPIGQKCVVTTPWGQGNIKLSLLGEFNLSNTLAVISILGCLGFSWDEIQQQIETVKSVSGRMERFGGNNQPLVVVDYAHTPDALTKALTALRAHCQGNLWCVFGCGGDRDPGKRPLMAAAAEKFSDQLIITDDNPRNEDGNLIISDVLSGLSRAGDAIVERDRAAAIEQSIKNAKSGDIILVAGKGHESYQLVRGNKLPHSDSEFVLQQLTELAS